MNYALKDLYESGKISDEDLAKIYGYYLDTKNTE